MSLKSLLKNKYFTIAIIIIIVLGLGYLLLRQTTSNKYGELVSPSFPISDYQEKVLSLLKSTPFYYQDEKKYLPVYKIQPYTIDYKSLFNQLGLKQSVSSNQYVEIYTNTGNTITAEFWPNSYQIAVVASDSNISLVELEYDQINSVESAKLVIEEVAISLGIIENAQDVYFKSAVKGQGFEVALYPKLGDYMVINNQANGALFAFSLSKKGKLTRIDGSAVSFTIIDKSTYALRPFSLALDIAINSRTGSGLKLTPLSSGLDYDFSGSITSVNVEDVYIVYYFTNDLKGEYLQPIYYLEGKAYQVSNNETKESGMEIFLKAL